MRPDTASVIRRIDRDDVLIAKKEGDFASFHSIGQRRGVAPESLAGPKQISGIFVIGEAGAARV